MELPAVGSNESTDLIKGDKGGITIMKGAACRVFLASAIIAWSVPPLQAADVSVGEFYKGKQMRLIIGSGPGEANDLYARLLARHLSKYIPGYPVIVPQNQASAGGLTAINSLYNVAPRDGTVIATGNRFIPMMPLLAMDGTRFDPLALSYIGSMNRETGVCLTMKSAGFRTLDDLKEREIIVGTVGAGAELTHFTSTLRLLLGWKMRLIAGYRTSNDINTAIDSGELEGRCGVSYSGLKTTRPEWLTNNAIDIQLQLGLRKDEELPDVPSLIELVTDAQDREALELMLAPAEMGCPFFAPPQLPPERLAALRSAFDASMNDDALLRDAEKMDLDITPLSGAEIEALIVRLYNAEASVVDRARVLANNGD